MTAEDDGSRYAAQVAAAEEFFLGRLGPPPQRVVILGSGWGGPPPECPILHRISYREIPFFPSVSVEGHRGELVLAEWRGERFCCARGRAHLYEGEALSRVVFPVRALARWGVRQFFLTNAAGAVRAEFRAGDLMLVRDHINLMGDNPLAGFSGGDEGDRFPDMTRAYSSRLRELARRCARRLGILLREGVYAAVKGPSYETPAEVRMLRLLGADAVGMSTVPEVITLRSLKREVLALSFLSNRAAGLFSGRLEHRRVLDAAEAARETLWKLLLATLEAAGAEPVDGPDRFDSFPRPASRKESS